jgi:hypothetical protein
MENMGLERIIRGIPDNKFASHLQIALTGGTAQRRVHAGLYMARLGANIGNTPHLGHG